MPTADHARYRELRQLDSAGFLSARYSRHTFVPHSHDAFAIGLVEEGCGRTTFRGEVHLAPAGSVMCLNPGDVHTGEAASSEACWRYRMVYPSASLVQQIIAVHSGPASPYVRLQAPVIYDQALAQLLRARFRDVDVDESMDRATLRCVVMHLFQHHATVEATTDGAQALRIVQMAMCFMTQQLHERLTLRRIAEHVLLSPFHFSRVFQAETGMPPYTWLEHARIREAIRLLRLGTVISRVALDTGFSDQSHLTRRFKRVVGVPPAQFARAVRSSARGCRPTRDGN